jgi:hypothetical protein
LINDTDLIRDTYERGKLLESFSAAVDSCGDLVKPVDEQARALLGAIRCVSRDYHLGKVTSDRNATPNTRSLKLPTLIVFLKATLRMPMTRRSDSNQFSKI